MPETNFRVLLIEDNPPDADLLTEMLSGQDECFLVHHVECMAAAESRLKEQPSLDIILLDLALPDSVGLASLERALCAASHLPIIVLTGLEDEALGVEAVRKGAQDYLVKGQTPPRMLVRVVRHAIERKRLEESLRQLRDLAERRAMEAQAASQAKSQFLANVSHELRTPMNAILGMIDLALRKEHDATTRDYLNTARESADVLLALLNDLLDSAKIESGKLELEAAPFRLRRVLEQIAHALSARASEKGLAFVCRVPDDLPDALVGDAVRLRQVLLNLAGNAIKFTERGEVHVSISVESLTTDKANLEFAVRDTGIGIPPADVERIFKPFAQGDASTARRFGGTGLGLSISANLVAMMGGRLWAESEPGQGSTFRFTAGFPLAEELPAAQEPRFDISASPARALRILLVEDNPANQKLATYVLREAGHTIDVAGDGQQALQMSEQNRYDVILMDVQMPGMDGVATTAAIRAAEEEDQRRESTLPRPPAEHHAQAGSVPRPIPASLTRRVPIIAMTAHAMKGDRERFLAAGMDGYLSKPIDFAELFAVIERLTAESGGGPRDAPPSAPSPAQAVAGPVDDFDPHLALARCGHSPEILGEMAGCLFEEADRILPQIHAALARHDLVEVSRLAHRLKGTLVYLGAGPATDAATAVEACDSGSQPEALEAVRALENQVQRLKSVLAEAGVGTRATRSGSV